MPWDVRQSPILWLGPFVLLLAGCARAPTSFPLPPARELTLAPSELEPPVADMGAADLDEYIVKDISSNGGASWRWTMERPTLRFVLNCTSGQKFLADFGVVEATLKQTGPIAISFHVNGRLLGTVDCPTPGNRHFEKDVPSSWLSTAAYTTVVVQASKVFVAEEDGAKLGFTLSRAGFVESCGTQSAF